VEPLNGTLACIGERWAVLRPTGESGRGYSGQRSTYFCDRIGWDDLSIVVSGDADVYYSVLCTYSV
jgi:hypothetical protein